MMFAFFRRRRAFRAVAGVLEEAFHGAQIPAPLTELLAQFCRRPTRVNADAVIGYHSGFDVFFACAERARDDRDRQRLREYAGSLRRLLEAEATADSALARLRQTNEEVRARLLSMTTGQEPPEPPAAPNPAT
jgi:hypothetical protein